MDEHDALVRQLDAAGLARMEVNARRLSVTGNPSTRATAQARLDAIDAERLRRRELNRAATDAKKREIVDKTRDLGLFDRVILAFSEVPAEPWEAEMLQAIADQPGSDWDVLAAAVGKAGGSYVNLALGSLCSVRTPYLATPEWYAKPEKKRWFSEYLVEFSHVKAEGGGSSTRWTLRPEAEAALRHLRVVR